MQTDREKVTNATKGIVQAGEVTELGMSIHNTHYYGIINMLAVVHFYCLCGVRLQGLHNTALPTYNMGFLLPSNVF